jgi:NarL family two-component system response regulator LiaR
MDFAEEASAMTLTESAPSKIRVMIVDDHPMVREGLRNLLEKQPDLEVVAEASDGELAVINAAVVMPDIVIMDISMPKLNGLEATKRIKAKYPRIAILVLTIHSDNEHALGILQAGAGGFLTKTASDNEILHAIHALSAGDTVLSPTISKQIFKYAFQYFKKPANVVRGNDLTTRELETLRLAAKGVPNKEIAIRLGISVRSTKAYLTNVFQKLNVASRTEAISVSLQTGLLTLEDIEP